MERRELIEELKKQKNFKSGYQGMLIGEAIRHLNGENLFKNVGGERRSREFSCGFETCKCGKRIEKEKTL